MIQFPDQTIPETQKDDKWCEKHIEYGRELFHARKKRIYQINKNFESYNGVVNERKTKYLTDKYGSQAKGQFKTFKLGKTKIDLVLGEWLLQPLSQTVATTNKDAISKKMKVATNIKGAMAARKEIEFLKKDLGMNLLEGMEIPEDNDPNLMEKLNPKTKNEVIMQKFLKDYVKREKLKDELYKNVSDVSIAGECFGKNEIQTDGKAIYRRIDPRYAVYEELEGDTYLERSQVIGEHRPMTIQQVLTHYWADLGEKGREKVQTLSKNPGNTEDYNQYAKYDERGFATSINVTTIEWFSVRPEYVKISPNTTDPNSPYKKDISPEYYEKNRKKIQKDVKKGKYEIKKTYKTDLWEATMIGKDILCRARRKPYQYRNQNQIGDTKYSYTGMLFNNHTGTRISIQELLDNIGFLYDVAWLQVTRELAKYKGKVFIYDLGALPIRKSLTKVLKEVTDDGILTVNGAADQNRGQRDVDISGIKELDLGLSAGFQQLFVLIDQLEDAADRITGLNENRQGNIAASSTATNAQSAIRASRTISEPMFYFIRRFTEEVMLKLASDIKLSKVFFDNESAGEDIVGDDSMSYMKITKDFAFDDFGVYISDGSREAEMRDRLLQLSEVALNAKQLRFQDVIKAGMQDTLAETLAVVENGFQEVERLSQQQQLQLGEQQAQGQQQLGQMETERREDQQQHEKDIEILKDDLEKGREVRRVEDQMAIDANKGMIDGMNQNNL